MTTTRPLIGRGVRAPDFALPRVSGIAPGGDGPDVEVPGGEIPGDGGPVRLYGQIGGRPVVMLFAADAPAVAAEVAGQLAAVSPHDLDVLVVTRQPGATTPREVAAYHDVDARVHDAYGVPAGVPHAVVLDANLRVTTTVALGEVEPAVGAIAAALPPPPADDGHAPRGAPVLYVPDAITAELRDRLLERWETGGAVETGVETVVDGERAEATDVRRKRRRDHVVTDPQLLRELTQHIGSRVFPELQKAFAFAAGGFEGFKIACYADTDHGHFEAHRDNLSSLTVHRRFGFSLNLNDGYTGGELRFPEYGSARHRPAAGEALLFSGSHLHEVLPVTAGRRFVLLSFVLAKGGTVAR